MRLLQQIYEPGLIFQMILVFISMIYLNEIYMANKYR